MLLHSLLMTAAVALAQNAAVPDPVDDSCTLASLQDVQVPAEEAGALMNLEVKEGMHVKAGMTLGHLDYRQAEAEMQVKKFDFDVANFRANSKVSVDYAQKAADVAEKVYQRYQLANKGVQNVVSQIDMMKYKLEWQKAALGTKKEEEELQVALLTSKAKAADVDAAKVALEKRTLKAPIDGVVVNVFRSVGEWVAPGDTVFRIVKVDRLKIESLLDGKQYSPSDVEGRAVTVRVDLPRRPTLSVPGKVTAVSPVLGVGQRLPVTIEVESPMENGQPVIRAGQHASITIHINEQAPAAARVPPRRDSQ